MQKRDFGIWRNRQPHGANPTAFLSGEDLGIPSGDVGIPTQSPEGILYPRWLKDDRFLLMAHGERILGNNVAGFPEVLISHAIN